MKWWRLGISLAIAAGAGLASWSAIHREREKIQSETVYVHVLRAKKFVKTGRPLTESDVTRTTIPAAFVEPTALTDVSELLDPEGGPLFRAKIGLQKNEQITRSKLIDKRTALGLSWLLKPEETAASVRLKSEQAAGGWIRPGDWVRVLATVSPQPGWPSSETVLVLDAARVLAVDDKIWDESASLDPAGLMKPSERDETRVTLAVSPAASGRLALADQKGIIHLNLLSALGHDKFEKRRFRLPDLK